MRNPSFVIFLCCGCRCCSCTYSRLCAQMQQVTMMEPLLVCVLLLGLAPRPPTLLSVAAKNHHVQSAATRPAFASRRQEPTSDEMRRSLQQDEDDAPEICYTGYVMDTYCIDRGTLFDSYLTDTLEEPNRHSIHCLVDVDRCVTSGFQILMDDPNDGGQHCRVFDLDEQGTNRLVDLARSTGEAGYCETCSGSTGAQVRGESYSYKNRKAKNLLPFPVLLIVACSKIFLCRVPCHRVWENPSWNEQSTQVVCNACQRGYDRLPRYLRLHSYFGQLRFGRLRSLFCRTR